MGRSAEQLLEREPGIDRDLLPHRTFPGNRPSVSLLFPQLTAYSAGQMLALYEHRTAIQVTHSLMVPLQVLKLDARCRAFFGT